MLDMACAHCRPVVLRHVSILQHHDPRSKKCCNLVWVIAEPESVAALIDVGCKLVGQLGARRRGRDIEPFYRLHFTSPLREPWEYT